MTQFGVMAALAGTTWSARHVQLSAPRRALRAPGAFTRRRRSISKMATLIGSIRPIGDVRVIESTCANAPFGSDPASGPRAPPDSPCRSGQPLLRLMLGHGLVGPDAEFLPWDCWASRSLTAKSLISVMLPFRMR